MKQEVSKGTNEKEKDEIINKEENGKGTQFKYRSK
jgi:hypothetical protein